MAKETDYSKMKVPELRDELKSRGLPYSGKKPDLIDRLNAAVKKSPKKTASKSPARKASKSPAKKPSTGRGRPASKETAKKVSKSRSSSRSKSPAKTDYNAMKVPELKEELKNRELSIVGNKAALVERLQKSDRGVITSPAKKPSTGRGRPASKETAKKVSKSRSSSRSKSPAKTDYNAMKVPELKEELKNRELSIVGNKAALVERLQKSDRGVITSPAKKPSTGRGRPKNNVVDVKVTENAQIPAEVTVTVTPTKAVKVPKSGYDAMNVKQLIEEARNRNLKYAGLNKAKLIALLQNAEVRVETKIQTPPKEKSASPKKVKTPPKKVKTPPKKVKTPPKKVKTPPKEKTPSPARKPITCPPITKGNIRIVPRIPPPKQVLNIETSE